MAANLLHIHLLGDFRLIDGDEPVTAVNSPRMQSLLTYLLLHRAAPQPRYHVAFLLWPDSPESQARSNLRNLLHRLRHAFPGIEAFLQEDNRDLCWRADAPFTFDVADFENALAQAQEAERAGDQDALQEALERAGGHYSGDLLPSCYDEWILAQREQLRQAFLEALERLSILQENRRY
ncbi:MAG TPA: BTAD domain-containing putative transcriptional regulator, partial [Pseudomonadales bacterium]|nr:BTAD domain-containing putative transcriptional regulator [Pseudomonadales bacterium]